MSVFALSACGEKGTWDPGATSGPGATPTCDGVEVPAPEDEGCDAACAEPAGGLTLECGKRFLYGINYAWLHFGGDFGGIASWSQPGVSRSACEHARNLATMRRNEVRVIRWWMFPDFRSDGVAFDASEVPLGLSGTVLDDLSTALELSAQTDVYLMLTLFSFDAFRPSTQISGRSVPSLQPIVLDPSKRGALLENVIRPLARAAAESPHAERLLAWDVINEPEWALAGENPYPEDEPFQPNRELSTVSHAEMETFLAEAIAVLRGESAARVTVGAASLRWARVWNALDLDFYQVHRYEARFPWDATPAEYGFDKPAMIGEFPLQGLGSRSYAEAVSAWYENGWAGTMPWQFDWAMPDDLGAIQAAGAERTCSISIAH